MDIGQLLTSAISSVIGILLAGQFLRWQHARAERNAAQGRPVSVPASLRTTEGSRLGALWRHGFVDIEGDRVTWTPRLPWGRSLVLSDVAYGSRRAPEGRLRFQLAPAAVIVSCSDVRRRYELAVLPASVKYLYWSQVAAA